jgi:hypothetical protein
MASVALQAPCSGTLVHKTCAGLADATFVVVCYSSLQVYQLIISAL